MALDVSGNIHASGTISSGQSLMIDATATPRSIAADNSMNISTLSGDITMNPMGNVGIATLTPAAMLEVDGSLLIAGSIGSTPVSGGGSRLMWTPSKSALRAGYVDGGEWDDANIGNRSDALGYNTVASSDFSTAFGISTTAANTAATSMGSSTNATGVSSTAMGDNSDASGDYSTAMGESTQAIGQYSTSTGANSEAIGDYSFASGSGTNAGGQASTAMGSNSSATGTSSFAAGGSTTAGADYSTAFGQGTSATGTSSFAAGNNSDAQGDNAVAFGNGTSANGFASTAFGNGTLANGTNATAFGVSTNAGGSASTAMGSSTNATGDYSTAMGSSTVADGAYSTAMGSNAATSGYDNTFVYGDGSASTSNDASGQFVARASGGFKFYDDASTTPVATIASGTLSVPTVGIGTSTPAYPLDVNGSARFSGHLFAGSSATAASSNSGVTVSDVPVFIITNGSTTQNFALTMPSGVGTGDIIIVINQDSSHPAIYSSTASVAPLGSRIFYFDGTSWQ
jgi:hypothetical protein